MRVLFSDLLGLAHGRVLPRDKGVTAFHLCMTLMAQASDGTDDIIDGYGVDVGSPDMEAVVDEASAIAGWQPDATVSMAALHRIDSGVEFELDPRWALMRAVEAWRALGLEPVTGFEMEFYLLEGPPDSEIRPLASPAHRPYGTGIGGDLNGLGQRIFDVAREAGLDVTALNAEFHPAQLEVVLNHVPAVRSADSAFLFRELAREVAVANDAWCTFLGKPMADRAGNGLHVNISAVDDSGANAFVDPDGEHGLSATARHAIAGILAHYPALCAIAAPTVNAYKRLQPGEIGGNADWGLDHRGTAVRVPGERGEATRLEFRLADGTAGPHLMSAAVLFAAYLGVQNELELPEPRVGKDPQTHIGAPRDLAEALDLLEKDDELVGLLGNDLVRTFLGLKRWEWRQWSLAVTDWEIRTYGRHF
jgi:glutamine synthetase